MHLNPDQMLQIAHERHERLRAEAAASRLAESVPTRTRLAFALRRAADRLDAATAAPARVGAALTERR